MIGKKSMIDRFLCWKLPSDFAPDCGVSFTPPARPHPEALYVDWPTGTNLLNAEQTKAMLTEVIPDLTAEHVGWMLDAFAEQHPGIMNLKYESGGEGVEFPLDVLVEFINAARKV